MSTGTKNFAIIFRLPVTKTKDLIIFVKKYFNFNFQFNFMFECENSKLNK